MHVDTIPPAIEESTMQTIETMPNVHYYKELEIIKRHLGQLRKAYIPLTGEALSSALTSDDLYLIPTVDRSMRLIDGFLQLMATRNLTCIGALLRLEIDTCFRSYALFIAEDPEALIQGYLEGEKISRFKDDQGERMTDRRLKERLSEYFPETAVVYDNASGYIHYSDKALRSIVRPLEDFDIGMGIGTPLPEDVNGLLVEAAGAFARFVTIHQKIIKDYSSGKNKRFKDDES